MGCTKADLTLEQLYELFVKRGKNCTILEAQISLMHHKIQSKRFELCVSSWKIWVWQIPLFYRVYFPQTSTY